MHVITTVTEVQEACRKARRPLGLVPTMGALHEGQLSLVRRARQENATVVASIFVNPLQFGPDEDLATYPRTPERDLALLEEAGTDLVFAPPPEEVYPQGFVTAVEVKGPALHLEGHVRPHHFQGVATVVTKLLCATLPDLAYFGRKDAQQVAVVRRMIRDLDIQATLVVLPTVREPDGLAMSSRNAYLSASERAAAPVLFRALEAARSLYQQGERRRGPLEEACRRVLEREPLVRTIDYVALVDPDDFTPVEDLGDGSGVLAAALHIGTTHLIDNVCVGAEAPQVLPHGTL